MNRWIDLARGPWLEFAFAVLVLGVLRQLVLMAVELADAFRRAGDRNVPVRPLVGRFIGWLVPTRALTGRRGPYAAFSLLLHAGMILVPLLLAGHVALVRRAWGIGWPVLPQLVADLLTLTTLAALGVLFVMRLSSPATRILTRLQDWLLPALLTVIFLTGYWLVHPATSLLPFGLTFLLHMLGAETLIVLVPFTKLSHLVLFPLTQLSWELGWHFVPGAGERVRAALGKQGEPV